MNRCCYDLPVKFVISFDCGVQSSEWSVCEKHEKDPLFQKHINKIKEAEN